MTDLYLRQHLYPRHTRPINAKAMFFMVADTLENILNYMKRLLDEVTKSVTIPIHHLGSFRHWTLTYAVDVTKADALLNTPYFRPPHGWLRHTVYWWVKQNYRVVMWDLVTRDYSKWLTADDVVKNVKNTHEMVLSLLP